MSLVVLVIEMTQMSNRTNMCAKVYLDPRGGRKEVVQSLEKKLKINQKQNIMNTSRFGGEENKLIGLSGVH